MNLKLFLHYYLYFLSSCKFWHYNLLFTFCTALRRYPPIATAPGGAQSGCPHLWHGRAADEAALWHHPATVILFILLSKLSLYYYLFIIINFQVNDNKLLLMNWWRNSMASPCPGKVSIIQLLFFHYFYFDFFVLYFFFHFFFVM